MYGSHNAHNINCVQISNQVFKGVGHILPIFEFCQISSRFTLNFANVSFQVVYKNMKPQILQNEALHST